MFDNRVWSEPAAACAGAESESATLTAAQLDALRTSRVVVVPRWLPNGTTSELVGEMRGLSTSGYLQTTPQKRVGVRGDAVGFLSEAEAAAHGGAATASVVRRLRELGDVLQRTTDAAVRVPTRVMATHYPGAAAARAAVGVCVRLAPLRSSAVRLYAPYGLGMRHCDAGGCGPQPSSSWWGGQGGRQGGGSGQHTLRSRWVVATLRWPGLTGTTAGVPWPWGRRRRRALRTARGQRRRQRPHGAPPLVVHRVL